MSETIPLDGLTSNSKINNSNHHSSSTTDSTDIAMSFDELIQACNQDADWVMELMEENIIEYDVPNTELFSGYQLAIVRRATRISRDFDASVPAIGLIIDLIDELEQLRQFKRQFENQCQTQDQVIEVDVE